MLKTVRFWVCLWALTWIGSMAIVYSMGQRIEQLKGQVYCDGR